MHLYIIVIRIDHDLVFVTTEAHEVQWNRLITTEAHGVQWNRLITTEAHGVQWNRLITMRLSHLAFQVQNQDQAQVSK